MWLTMYANNSSDTNSGLRARSKKNAYTHVLIVGSSEGYIRMFNEVCHCCCIINMLNNYIIREGIY
jgi:hypothetical protein